jgi:hypothetical protein
LIDDRKHPDLRNWRRLVVSVSDVRIDARFKVKLESSFDELVDVILMNDVFLRRTVFEPQFDYAKLGDLRVFPISIVEVLDAHDVFVRVTFDWDIFSVESRTDFNDYRIISSGRVVVPVELVSFLLFSRIAEKAILLDFCHLISP